MTATPNLFAFPAASPAARENIKISIEKPISTSVLNEHLDPAAYQALLGKTSTKSGIFAWGALPRKNNKNITRS